MESGGSSQPKQEQQSGPSSSSQPEQEQQLGPSSSSQPQKDQQEQQPFGSAASSSEPKKSEEPADLNALRAMIRRALSVGIPKKRIEEKIIEWKKGMAESGLDGSGDMDKYYKTRAITQMMDSWIDIELRSMIEEKRARGEEIKTNPPPGCK